MLGDLGLDAAGSNARGTLNAVALVLVAIYAAVPLRAALALPAATRHSLAGPAPRGGAAQAATVAAGVASARPGRSAPAAKKRAGGEKRV